MAVAAGDFDGNGFDDMAVGIPGAQVGRYENAGQVEVVYGTDNGLDVAAAPKVWHRDVDAIEGGPREDDRFGEVLAVGDFDNDGQDDLAVGVPGDDINGMLDAGVVNVVYASGNGGFDLARSQH